MCKQVNGKKSTLLDIMARLEAKKHSRLLVVSNIVYSKQEIDSARTVLDRLLEAIPAAGSRDSTNVSHSKIRI